MRSPTRTGGCGAQTPTQASSSAKPVPVHLSRGVLLGMFHVKLRVLDFSPPRTKDGAYDSARQ